MASFVKLFKRKTPKQSSLSDYFNSTEVHTTSKINAMQDGKQFRASSLRINKKPHAHKKETNGGYEECTKNVIENSHYRSPYSVFTEPKKDRSTRSCPVGPPDNKETDRIQKFHKFTPPFYVQATIHEKSGSYENLTTSQLKQRFWAEKHSEREKEGKAREGESEGKKERACGKRKEEKPKKHKEDMDGLVTYGTRDNLAKRRHGRHFTAHCSHHNPSQQPLSTSEYWSADPSPMAEDQPHRHLRISQRSTCEFREEMMMALVGLEAGKEEEGSSEDGDSSSDDQEISPTALLQFWQQQVRMLKCELKSSRETAEKYRSKYLRLKTKTDELSSELTREKERNIWLFNQLIATNDQITQLNWAQLHFRDSQRQHNFLSMNSAESVGNNSPLLEKCEINAHHRSTAGEVQAELSSDDFEYKSTAFRKGICNVETDRENAQQTMDQQQKQSIRTPTPIPMGSANNVTNGLLMNNSFCAPGTPFLNFNLFHNAQQVHNQLQVEVARGNHSNGFRNSNSRLISPTIKKGITKAINDNSPMTMEEDENGEQMSREEEGDNESLSGTDPEEHCPIVIPLDLFCQQQIEQKSSSKELMEGSKETLERRATMSAKYLLRHSRSSEDLRFSEKGAMIGCSTMGSSSEDDIRMWKKQLRSRGKKSDRVLFRPSRKSLFSGIIVKDEKGPNKIFRRFGQPEREALAKFDYLRDERSDLSGLMSSPEKIAEIN